jgi:hypothetical protein
MLHFRTTLHIFAAQAGIDKALKIKQEYENEKE